MRTFLLSLLAAPLLAIPLLTGCSATVTPDDYGYAGNGGYYYYDTQPGYYYYDRYPHYYYRGPAYYHGYQYYGHDRDYGRGRGFDRDDHRYARPHEEYEHRRGVARHGDFDEEREEHHGGFEHGGIANDRH